MIASRSDLFAVLQQYNPWWAGERPADLPQWRRAAFHEIRQWAANPPAGRALLLSGARQIGKTTLFLQVIDALIRDGVNPNNILYATFDHPLLKLTSLDELLKLRGEMGPPGEGVHYLFLDEIQSTANWQVWLKHQVDFEKHRRIAVTGSATPLVTEGQESGVGRWQTIRIATLSFFEYLQIKKLAAPELPPVTSLAQLYDWNANDFTRVAVQAQPIVGLFHDYLLRGGFPQCALIESLTLAQKLLREDIVDKVLKRDMTALFGVRRIVELEQTFLYLCLHDGGLLDLPQLCSSLQLKRPTVENFINLLEAAHLLYRLRPFGYGKEVLRGRPKLYLADAAIAPAVLLKGRTLLEDATALGQAVETAFFKHVFTRYYSRSIGFSYWRGRHEREVDIIADVEGQVTPFEVKYRGQVSARDLKGLDEFCTQRNVQRGYVITRELDDFGPIEVGRGGTPARLMRVPAALACYWLSRSEATQ